jgi:hypothetical protein
VVWIAIWWKGATCPLSSTRTSMRWLFMMMACSSQCLPKRSTYLCTSCIRRGNARFRSQNKREIIRFIPHCVRVLLLRENAKYRNSKQRIVALELVQNLRAVTWSGVGVRLAYGIEGFANRMLPEKVRGKYSEMKRGSGQKPREPETGFQGCKRNTHWY